MDTEFREEVKTPDEEINTEKIGEVKHLLEISV